MSTLNMLNPLYGKIERAKIAIQFNDPALARLLNCFPVYLHRSHPTAATNGKVIYFGETFLQSLSVKDTVFVLLHELMHILLKHVGRKGYRDHKRYNVACDIIVNDLLKHHGYNYEQLHAIEGSAFNIFGELESVEVVYDNLKDCESLQTVSNHFLWEELSQEVLDSITEGLISVSKEHTSSLLNEVLKWNKDDSRKLTLDDVLLPYLVDDTHDYHYQRVDHRYEDVLLPYYSSVDVTIKNLWIVIDVSNSMTQRLLEYIFNQLKNLWLKFPKTSFQLSFFSFHLTPPRHIKTVKELQTVIESANTSGGTDMSVVFQDYDTYFARGKPVANIIITDGDGDPPPSSLNPKNLTVWVLTEASDFEPEFGKTIRWKDAYAHTNN